MNSIQSANHILNLIINEGKQKIHQNKIVQTFYVPFSNDKFDNLKSSMLMQTGIKNDLSKMNKFKKSIKQEQKPQPNTKDISCFFSVKKDIIQKQKINKSQERHKNQNNKNIKRRKFFSNTNKSIKQVKIKSNSFCVDQNINCSKGSLRSTIQADKEKHNNFIELDINKPKSIPRWQQKQQIHIQQLRERIDQRQIKIKQQQQNAYQQQRKNKQRQQKLTTYLQNHISRPNTSYTFDIQGELLLFNNPNYFKKQFPPKIQYDILNEEDNQHSNSLRYKKQYYQNKNKKSSSNKQHSSQLQFSRKQQPTIQNYKLNGARGQIFKSSVLKTINLSKLSFGNNQINQHQFMKRNDLFNNNHSRQTSSIPFIQIQNEGVAFKQPLINQEINKNTDRETQADSKLGITNNTFNFRPKSQQRTKSQFIKYSSKITPNSTYTNSFYKNKNPREIHSTNNHYLNSKSINRNQQSFQMINKRPKTTQFGRIKKQNESLYLEIFQ